jgi:3'-phosphoadenosine 5'-phosphosulfate sulfotransferase (PAPS reductase)/FAD synthetase
MMEHFILPEGNVAIAFSGGRTSAMMLHHILEANGGLPSRAVVSFQNTGREMPETLDFVQECGERWGVPIVWLEYQPEAPRFRIVKHATASRDGEPFAALIRKRRMLPNRVARFCTAEMKVHALSRYLRARGWAGYRRALGIRADEQKRIATKPNKEAWSPWYPMADAGLSKADVAAFWRRQPFDLRLANIGGKTPLGNCDGCFLKSEANLAALAREHPDRAAWWAAQELSLAVKIGKGGGAWFNQRRPMADVMRMVAMQGDWIFDAEGALCQADDGECTG